MMLASTKSLSLLIVDDHEVVRVGLRTVLNLVPGLQVVGEAGTGLTAVDECQRHQPDIVLLDIRLPDRSGVEVCHDILGVCPKTRVVFLTSYADDETVLSALVAGAHGYVLKEGSNKALIEAIKTVAAGQSLLDPQVTARTLSLIRSRYTPGGKSRLNSLSAQEERVLKLVAEGKTNKEIAVSLGLSDKTVKNYIANIYDKLQVSRRSQATAVYLTSQR